MKDWTEKEGGVYKTKVVFHEELTSVSLPTLAEGLDHRSVPVVLPTTIEQVEYAADDDVSGLVLAGNTDSLTEEQKEGLEDQVIEIPLSEIRDELVSDGDLIAQAEYSVVAESEADAKNWKFAALKEALEYAEKSAKLSGLNRTVIMRTNYEIKENITIPENVTLLLPYDTSKDLSRGVGVSGTSQGSIVGFDGTTQTNNYQSTRGKTEQYCDLTVNVAQGVTITNLGTLNIGGITSGGSGLSSNPSNTTTAKYAGQTASGYARLVLGDNAKIVSSGAINSFGFIEEENKDHGSEIVLENGGSIKMPFIVREHRGGNAFWKMVDNAISGDVSSKLKTSPFNRFFMENVHPKLTVSYGAKVFGAANLYANKSDNKTDIPLIGTDIGTDNQSMIQLKENAKAIAKFDTDTAVTALEIKGSMKLNALSLALKVLIMTIELNTKAVFFPLSWYYHVTLSPFEDGEPAIVDATAQKIKLLPGASLTVGENVTMNASELVVYQGGVFSGIYDSGGDYEKNTEATFTVNGTLIANKLAGTVLTTGSNANLEVTEEVTIATQEVSSSSSSSVLYKGITTTLTLAGVEAPTNGKYTSVNGQWQAVTE